MKIINGVQEHFTTTDGKTVVVIPLDTYNRGDEVEIDGVRYKILDIEIMTTWVGPPKRMGLKLEKETI